MTVGIICLDGLDHRLAREHGLFEPVGAEAQPLLNDLEGENPLFTPRVWNSIFLGRDQQEITDWITEADWQEDTSGWDFIWDSVVGTSLLNVNVHSGYLHQNACIPEGWTPYHGSWGMMCNSTLELIDHWNETLELHQPPLMIGYWRIPDAFGHWAGGKAQMDSHEPVYQWLREEFWQHIELPERWLVMSDHGFTLDLASIDRTSGREAHSEHGCMAASFELPQMQMSDWIPTWQDLVIRQVRHRNLEALGYT